MIARSVISVSYTFILLFFLLVPTVSSAQANSARVEGTVLTVEGKPAVNIIVTLKNSIYGTTTDKNGYFRFYAPTGEYILEVSSINTALVEYSVILREGVNRFDELVIKKINNVLPEVVVTGQFSPVSLRNSVYKVKVISNERILRKAATDVGALLNTETGIRWANDLQLGETDFEIMGMNGSNVKVLLDGIPLIDRGDSRQSLNQIDINTIERIELVEGPMSVVYGTDALAGVINIITKKPLVDKTENLLSVSAGFQEESIGREYNFFIRKGIHTENFRLGWSGKNGFYVNGGFTRNQHGGWRGDRTGREREWAPKEQLLYSGILGYSVSNFYVSYRLDYLDERIKIPINGTPAEPLTVTDRKYLTDRYTHQFQSNYKINDHLDFNLAASYQNYKRTTRTVVTDQSIGQQWLSLADSAQDTSRLSSWFTRLTALWAITPQIRVQPGLEYKRDKASGDRITGSPSISDAALFVSAEWTPTGSVNLRPGFRTFIFSDYDAPALIPVFLAKFSLTDNVDLRASYAYGFRSPALRELYFSFHNANHNIDGNPNLKSEYSNNFTASVTWRIKHNSYINIVSVLSGFYNSFRDRIALAADVNDQQHMSYYNIDKYKTTGGTLENTLIWNGLKLEIGLSIIGRYNSLYGNSSYKDKKMDRFRYSPELSGSASYTFKTGTDVNFFYKFTGHRREYYIDDAGEIFLGGLNSFSWGDVSIGHALNSFVSVRGGIKNIFNITHVRNSAGGDMHNEGGVPLLQGYGTSYFIGMNFRFN